MEISSWGFLLIFLLISFSSFIFCQSCGELQKMNWEIGDQYIIFWFSENGVSETLNIGKILLRLLAYFKNNEFTKKNL